jgi:UDP-N-acetylmuramyl tripeptide synthase
MNQMETEGHKIPDRREAIAFLLRSAKEGDAVVLCGMGACTSMQTREGLRPWDEREVARELLHSRP